MNDFTPEEEEQIKKENEVSRGLVILLTRAREAGVLTGWIDVRAWYSFAVG